MLLMGLLLFPSSMWAQVAIIAHPSVPISDLDRGELLDLYTGEIESWDDGNDVIVLDLKTRNETRKRFYDYLGKSASRIKSIWIKKKLSGEGNPPQSFQTDEEIIDKVISTPGSIAFVSSSVSGSRSNSGATLENSFKTLMIIPE